MIAASHGGALDSGALDDLIAAATDVSALVSGLVREQPIAALGVALGVGFIAGGGLSTPLGTRLTAVAARATFGKVATVAALEVLRRGLGPTGESRVRPDVRPA
jgi:hypothetical protein